MGGNFRRAWPLHLFIWPAVLFVLIYNYIPMLGTIIAFQDYKPWLGITNSAWVGLEHFKFLFTYPDSILVLKNTLVISSLKLIANLIVPLVFALLLNEVRVAIFKKSVQTLVYLPYFLSWVIVGGILIDMLSVDGGIVNRFIGLFGVDPIMFLGDKKWFLVTLVVSEVWKEFGFSAIVFLAVLTGINPTLYEAAEIDGANRWKQTLYITLPGMIPIVIVVGTLALGRILDAGFDQVFNLYNPMVYETGDIIDTFVYRIGLINGQFSFATAVGLFKSVVGFVLILLAYRAAYKYGNYRIF